MKIACVTSHDATTPDGYGVRTYYMTQALKDQCESMEYIGPFSVPKIHSLLFKTKTRFYNKFSKRRYSYNRDQLLLKEYARQISKKLSGINVDIVFSPVSFASQPIAYLESNLPIVIWTDATFAAALDFYPTLNSNDICKETIRDSIANERNALSRCSLVIYSSEWAAQTALENYQIHPSKVRVVPFGANIHCNRELNDIKTIVELRPSNKCKLLFLGADWYRKGGDIAVQVTKTLNEAGLDTELTVVGCDPLITDEPLPSFVRFLGYISKSTKEGSDKMDKLLSESHFLILPTRADCTPNVIPEANSFGIPCITTNIGGIPTMVRDSVNGKTFSKDVNIEEYCKYIFNLFSDYTQYKKLALSAFNEYQTRLNWSVNTQAVKKLMSELIY
ncbi:MAG: glycosyltransferase family 4 protein [Fischerella sp.]|uniref:glycosyltransferase family 4 protein n=1 Tax=Fischerella sp. TaxID=1191 RepID=UPI0017C313A1|nr:glycosyltransferase family 4 protein [Fischerella sp.]NWF57767.1 glycosyltransferase family 4 protein [Fischerella sp.]